AATGNYFISDVLVDGLSVGAVASHTFSNVTAVHTIEAIFTINSYTLTPTAGSNGSFSPPSATNVNYGDDFTFAITPDLGYHVADVLVDGSSVGATGSYTFLSVAASHSISATFAINTYIITPTAESNGSISPAIPTAVNFNDDQTFAITPDLGYHVAEVIVDGVNVGALSSYTFTNVSAPHTIEASFAINSYTITPNAGSNGSITPSVGTSVYYGNDLTFTITPDAGYHVADVLVDGSSVGATGSYTFSSVAASHTISATFAINTYTLSPSAGSNGSITPSVATVVDYGDNQTFTITPDAGYHIANVLVDGSSVGATGSYTFSSVAASHTISATFAINTYSLTPSAGSNGSITPSVATVVDYGDNQTFTITPDAGYHIANVLVDGSSVGAVGSYTFFSVAASHTISATFAINTYTLTPTSGSNGSVTPPVATTVDYGDDLSFTITPDLGYHIADVLVDGSSVGAVGSYTFFNITTSHTISATFAINTYILTPTAESNGSITPSVATTVDVGDDQTFSINPDIGYEIADVQVDGSSVGEVSSYTFSNVTTGHTIHAFFRKIVQVVSVSIPNATMNIGDIVSATITVIEDVGMPYSFVSGSIGGYSLYGLQRINSTTYLANFNVTQGGNTYYQSDDIPVSNLIITDGSVQSAPYNTPIIQGSDLLDGSVPVVSTMSVEPGIKKIGDLVELNISADGSDYSILPSSTINGIAVTESNIFFDVMGGGSYRLRYFVEQGDSDVQPGEISASIVLVKPSGNLNIAQTSIVNRDVLMIDAHPPVISRLEVPSIEVGPDGTVQVTITADGNGYSFGSGTTVNGVPLSSSNVTGTEHTGGLYELSYVVSTSDQYVSPGDLEVSLVLADPAGNISTSFTSV
ncbi:MAG: hypothetical protein DRQ62_15625, partial [Gammaproteobacteria bacterium]